MWLTKKNAIFLKELASQKGGRLSPKDVVNAARPIKSPIHDRFEWDNTKAAEQYRLEQAKHLIRVTIELMPTPKRGEVKVRTLCSLSSDRGSGKSYRVTEDVMSDEELRKIMLRDALDELQSFERKYACLTELAAVFTAIKKVQSKTKLSRNR